MSVTKQQIQRMSALFRGYERKSGTHGVPDREPGALKWNIKRTARWQSGPTTDEMWRQHLEGERPLGIVPIRGPQVWRWRYGRLFGRDANGDDGGPGRAGRHD